MPRRGDTFRRANYMPRLGDVVHLDWPAAGHDATSPRYGLVLSADIYNQVTGLVVVAPITPRGGTLSGFELPLRAGRVDGVAVLSALRSLDYQHRDIRYEDKADSALAAEGNRRVRMIFP